MLSERLKNQLLHKDKVPFYLYCLLGIAIPQPLHLERLAVVLLFISGAYVVISRGKLVSKKSYYSLPALLPALFIAMHVVGLLYSDDLVKGWKSIETKLALIVVPLFVYYVWNDGLSNKKINQLLLCFIISCITAYLYMLFRASLLLLYDNSSDASQLSFAFSRDNLASYLSQHPIYIALIAACCIQVLFYLLTQYWKNYTFLKKLVLSFALFISFGIVILMGARMSLIAVTFTVLIWLSLLIIRQRKFFLGSALIIIFIIAITAAVVYVPNIKVRFKEIADTEFAPPRGAYHNSTNLRVGQLYCSIAAIKDNYLVGTGTGDYQSVLNTCYQQNNFSDVLYILNYNSHNQYLQSFLSLGLLGIILLLSMVLVPIWASIKSGDWLLVMLFVVLSLSMLTESVIQTNLGVMIFSFVYGLFVIRYLQNKNKPAKSNQLQNTSE